MMKEVSEHVGMNTTPTVLTVVYVAEPVDDFLFLWEEAGSAESPIKLDEDEYFSETMTPPAPQQALQPRPALRSIENFQNSR